MSPLAFTKYHGAGNDFVVLDQRRERAPEPLDELAVRLCHRRYGLGADGILLIEETTEPGCELGMRIINSDGSPAEMCGNGLRCVVKHVLDERAEQAITVSTGAGPLEARVERGEDGLVQRVRVDMGRPILERAKIPVAGDGEGDGGERVIAESITHPDGPTFRFTAVSMGNPHAVIFLDADLDPLAQAKQYGPGLESHPWFPRKANISFVRATGQRLDSAVWERGAGLTAACGTGACAIGVAACLEKRVSVGEPMEVVLPGGVLEIEVAPDLGRVWMTGPAVRVAEGKVDLDGLAFVEACRRLTGAIE